MAASFGRVYRQWLLRMLGKLHLRAWVWRIYCRCFGPEGGILTLELGESRAKFYVNSQLVLTELSSFGGERDLLTLLMSKLKPGNTAFDVGAGMGMYSVFLSKAVGEHGLVVAFEPDDHFRERVTANVKLNGLRNVLVLQMALGDRSCASELLPGDLGTAAPRVAQVRPERVRAGMRALRQKVRVAAGDDLIEEGRLPIPQVVKIDVEGFEHSVMRGLARTLSDPACELLCCEIHPTLLPEGITPENLVNLIQTFGFARLQITRRGSEQHVLAFKGDGEAQRR